MTSTPGVTLGSNGWLYLASDVGRFVVPGNPTVHARAARRLQANRRGEARLARRARNPVSSDHPAEQGHDLSGIHAAAYNKVNSRSRLDQLVDYMKSHSSVSIIDVRDDLRRAKQVERVYDVTDSHWNSEGGYVAYARIMQALNAWFPQAQAMPRSEFLEVVESGPGGDLAKMLGIADKFRKSD